MTRLKAPMQQVVIHSSAARGSFPIAGFHDWLVCLIIHFCITVAASSSSQAQAPDFARQIRPLLNRHCLACHGADEENRAADLRLDNFASATEAVIVPSEPEESELYARISSDDPNYVMPPPEHAKLEPHEIKLLYDWIRAGANYSAHWAFIKPTRPELPETKLQGWTSNEIDHFILTQLESQALKPSPLADPHRLLRRLSLDLVGLPPTDEQIARLVAKPNLETYEQLVDELLAAPAFGEHWTAVCWTWLAMPTRMATTSIAIATCGAIATK